MALIDKKVSEAYSGRDIASLSDRPNEDGLTAQDLKARFDQLGKEVIPKYNQVIDILVAGNIEEIMSAGQGINVIDVYDTYLEFITAHPTGNINDIYGVRVAPNVQTYIWSVASSVWKEFALIGDKDKIGNLVYTENNYITDGEEVTDSLDKLDIALKDLDDAKQSALVSGTNIKTINGDSVLGSEDLELLPKNNPTATGTQTFPNIVTNGIKFPATQVPSADPNTLDDYEEGGFTPIVIGLTTPGTGQAYSVQIGKYIKVGENVQIWGRVIMTNKGNPTGPILIGGLPFSSSFIGRTKAIIVIVNSVTATTLDNVHGSYVSAQNVVIANSSGLAINCTQLTNTSQFDFYASYPAA